jgi:nascent polypeptide-associated complex subunit alpha
MDAQGQETYQVVGEPEHREPGGGDGADADAEDVVDAETDESGALPDDDVELVATRAGVSEDAAREALAAEDGDLAAAIARLE